MPTTSTTGATQLIRVRNTTDKEQELWIEPLGDRVVLSPDVLYELAATNALEEIDISADGFVVHGWVTRVTALSGEQKGRVIWELPT
jgi:hypothetical protein